jgi:hypothetical protein
VYLFVIGCNKREAFVQGSGSDAAIHRAARRKTGLLRFARNDDSAYARGRRHAGCRATRTIARSISDTRLQIVKTNASRLHCHCGPSAALWAGSGEPRPITTAAATQASETKANVKTRCLRVHQLWDMAVLLFGRR